MIMSSDKFSLIRSERGVIFALCNYLYEGDVKREADEEFVVGIAKGYGPEIKYITTSKAMEMAEGCREHY